MPRTSKANSSAPVRRKRSASKGESFEISSPPGTGNVSVTINVWPAEASSEPKRLPNVIPWIWEIIRNYLKEIWTIVRS
jgi:hypothetical protein